MPLQYVVGTGGVVALPTGLNLVATSWGLTITQGVDQFTPLASQWQVTLGTNGAWSGTCTGKVQFDSASTSPVPITTTDVDIANMKGTVTLTAATGCTYSGACVISQVSIDRPENLATATVTITFEGNGVLGTAWDQTS